jgi:hypothetical protein
LLLAVLFTGCADVTPIKECIEGEPCGFWHGLWHGMILPFSLIISLFKDDVAIYAVNNNGGWYNFGFVLGVSALSSSKARCLHRT